VAPWEDEIEEAEEDAVDLEVEGVESQVVDQYSNDGPVFEVEHLLL
jgi:hypothetical protein